MISHYLSIFAGLFGLLIGSFLNVVIYRMPRNLSVVTPRSSCPKCHRMIRWYENIPILSYLLLRGRCYGCHVKIPWRYPLVEMIMGISGFLLAPASLSADDLFSFTYYFSIAAIFLAHILIDLEHHLLLDKLNLYLLAIVLPYAVIKQDIVLWLGGGLLGFFGPYLIGEFYFKLRGIQGLGGGDIKLFGILGIILGPLGVVHNIFLSCATGAIVGILLILTGKMKKDTPYAFGPFIIVMAMLQIFAPELVDKINPLTF